MRSNSQSSRLPAAIRRFWIVAGSASIIALVAFHGFVLLRRVEDSSITRPLVLGRWAFAIALLIGVLLLRRLRVAGGGRRAAIVFWLLVAVLHLAVPADGNSLDAQRHLATLVEAALFVPAAFMLAILIAALPNPAPIALSCIGVEPVTSDCSRRSHHGNRAPPLS
jgi:hypothetical protein